jgi:dephospho-CoA kinase
MQLIGLTGGIASGKSSVGRLIASAGVPVVDADILAREAVAPGTEALKQIVETFGDVLLSDGSLDRKKLGEIIFGDDEKRRTLNSIVHPEVARLAMLKLAALREAGTKVAVYEVPLLFENNLEGMMDATILVAASMPVQIERLMARDMIDEIAARARIAAQMPLDEKRKRATAVIENDGSLDDTAKQLRDVWRKLTKTELHL